MVEKLSALVLTLVPTVAIRYACIYSQNYKTNPKHDVDRVYNVQIVFADHFQINNTDDETTYLYTKC